MFRNSLGTDLPGCHFRKMKIGQYFNRKKEKYDLASTAKKKRSMYVVATKQGLLTFLEDICQKFTVISVRVGDGLSCFYHISVS